MVPLAIEIPLDASVITGICLAIVAAIGTGLKLHWSWVTNLVNLAQADAALARQQFTEINNQARKEFVEANAEARKDFMEGLTTLHTSVNDMHDTLVAVSTTIRERGVPAPQKVA